MNRHALAIVCISGVGGNPAARSKQLYADFNLAMRQPRSALTLSGDTLPYHGLSPCIVAYRISDAEIIAGAGVVTIADQLFFATFIVLLYQDHVFFNYEPAREQMLAARV